MFNNETKINKYIVMSKIDGQSSFYQQKGFSNKEDADAYAKLMIKCEDYDKHKYYLFEQSISYNDSEKDV
jgi:hypothetical protein